jgi:putative peptidoglycan lipid II flippase
VSEALRGPAHSPAPGAGTLARAGLLVSAAALASRALGWVRLIVVAAIFGASPELDAYFAAFRIPDAIFQLVAGGVVASVLIPLIARLSQRDADRAWRAVSGVANVLLVVLLALVALSALAAPLLVPAIAPGFAGEQLALTVDLSRLMLLATPLFLLGAVASSVLHSQGRFGAPAVAPLLYNASIIAAALLLSGELGVRGLAIGVVAGAAGYLAAVGVPLLRRTGYRHHLSSGIRVPGVAGALGRLAPRSLGLAGAQLIFIVNTAIATTLGAGAVTSYTLAFSLLLAPLGIISAPLAMIVFPSLARSAAAGDDAGFRRDLLSALRIGLWSAVLMTAVLLVLREPLVDLVYGHGAIDASVLATVAAVSVPLFLGLTAHTMNLVIARAFYAQGDTVTPVAFTLGQVALTVVIAIVLAPPLGLVGLGLAVAGGSWVKAVATLWLLERKVGGGIGLDRLTSAALRHVLAGLVAASVALAGSWLVGGLVDAGTVVGRAVIVLAVGGAASLAYMAVSLALGLPEARRVLELAREVARAGGSHLRFPAVR